MTTSPVEPSILGLNCLAMNETSKENRLSSLFSGNIDNLAEANAKKDSNRRASNRRVSFAPTNQLHEFSDANSQKTDLQVASTLEADFKDIKPVITKKIPMKLQEDDESFSSFSSDDEERRSRESLMHDFTVAKESNGSDETMDFTTCLGGEIKVQNHIDEEGEIFITLKNKNTLSPVNEKNIPKSSLPSVCEDASKPFTQYNIVTPIKESYIIGNTITNFEQEPLFSAAPSPAIPRDNHHDVTMELTDLITSMPLTFNHPPAKAIQSKKSIFDLLFDLGIRFLDGPTIQSRRETLIFSLKQDELKLRRLVPEAKNLFDCTVLMADNAYFAKVKRFYFRSL